MLLSIPIEGEVVNRKSNMNESISEELLGVRLIEKDIRGLCIKHMWLKKDMMHCV